MPENQNSETSPIVVYQNRLSLANRIGRVVWAVVYWSLFRFSPRPLYFWRNFLLRCFGAKLGKKVVIHSSVKIWAPWNLEMDDYACLAFGVDCYCAAKVHLGARATVSQYAFLCTASHDLNDPHTPLVTKPISLARNSWVFAGAFVGPGVSMGEGAVAAAKAVVVKDVEPWTIVGGNPAKFIKIRKATSVAKE